MRSTLYIANTKSMLQIPTTSFSWTSCSTVYDDKRAPRSRKADQRQTHQILLLTLWLMIPHTFIAAPTGPMATRCTFPLVRKCQITCRSLIKAQSGKSWMTLGSTRVGRKLKILWICEMRHQRRPITLICIHSLVQHCIPHMYTIPFTYFHASRIAIIEHICLSLEKKIAHICSQGCSLAGSRQSPRQVIRYTRSGRSGM